VLCAGGPVNAFPLFEADAHFSRTRIGIVEREGGKER